MNEKLTEKEQIERATANAFIELYNEHMDSDFAVVEYSDAPDVICRDSSRKLLALEVTLTQDRPGDIKSILGRSDKYSIGNVKRNVEAIKRGEAEAEVNCLQGNVSIMFRNTVAKKAKKDYGKNVALVVRDSSPISWDWEMNIETIRQSIIDFAEPFDNGIWILTFSKDRLIRVL